MIPKDVIKQIRRIQITTSRAVTDLFSGQYHSVFKGRGIEFDEVREYQHGDDVRSIDWNVTARMGHPYIKKFVEERELSVILILDVSGSNFFGTVNKLKSQIAAEICSVLAFSAIKNNDKVGLLTFSSGVEKYIPPKKGSRHVLRIIREALYSVEEYGASLKNKSLKTTNISSALEYLNKVATRKTVTFLISDFYSDSFEKSLRIANKKHDVIAISITDPSEINLPNAGIVCVKDAETNQIKFIDTSDKKFRAEYSKKSLARIDSTRTMFSSLKVDYLDIRTDKPYVNELFKFFKLRERRLRG